MALAPLEPVNAPEPPWPAVIAVLAVGGLHLALPDPLTFGPSWLLLAVVAVMLIPVLIARFRGSFALNQTLGYVLLGVVTAAMLWSLTLLVRSLPGHQLTPAVLLRSAAALWVTNILVFASWYWRLDAGGPHARHVRGRHTEGDFLFPQMTIAPSTGKPVAPGWSPDFVDYLFLAFNTSTAFSPTDSPVLSRWAKVLMMIQSSISLATLALLAARGSEHSLVFKHRAVLLASNWVLRSIRELKPIRRKNMAMKVSEVFVDTLATAGVKRVYGVTGDSLNGITDAIRRNKQIEWMHVRNEEAAAFAASIKPSYRRDRRLRGKLRPGQHAPDQRTV